jgi:nucleoside-diphosphate-sugar epimerase
MKNALIGHTGFIGQNIWKLAPFDDGYNSQNIDDIAGKKYDLVFCCGTPGERWRANKFPDADKASIGRLTQALEKAEAARFILMSTIDVFSAPRGKDEDAPVDLNGLHPYGRHRFEFENFVRRRFKDARIFRLPSIFGPGLKKNVVFDFLNDNELHKIHSESRMQFFPAPWLWRDIQKAAQNDLRLVHFATEPIVVKDVARALRGMDFKNDNGAPPADYNILSRHAALFGGKNGHLYGRDVILKELRDFGAAMGAPR